LRGWEPTPIQRALPPPVRKKPPITKSKVSRPADPVLGAVQDEPQGKNQLH